MAEIDLSPLNDCAFAVYLEVIDPVTGASTPLVAANAPNPTAFLATSAEPDAPVADATITVSITSLEAQAAYGPGYWMCELDGQVLLVANCAALFETSDTTKKPFVHVVRTNDLHITVPLKYKRKKTVPVV